MLKNLKGEIMKKTLSLILAFILIFSVSFTMSACKKADETTRMEVDINPSIEFMLDKDGNVASVTALNEDGSIVISGEEFVGKSADEALSLMIKISKDAGYISEDDSAYEVTVSLTGNEDLYKDIKNKVNTYISKNNLNVTLKQAEGLSLEVLKAKVKLVKPEMTEEELIKLTKQEMLDTLKDARIETANLISEDMKNMYYQVRDSKIQIARSQEIYNLISTSQNSLVTQYGSFLNSVETAITGVENANMELFSSGGAYQQAYDSLFNAKKELMETKSRIAKLNPENPIEKIQIDTMNALLPTLESAITVAENTLNQVKETAQLSINNAITILKNTYQNLLDAETQLKETPEISQILNQNANEIETALNQAKDNAFKNFETEYNEMITNYNQKIASMKNELLNK